jgi:hypothetical protein
MFGGCNCENCLFQSGYQGRLNDPERYDEGDLPTCSKPGCENAAGIVMGGTLFCFEHASQALDEKKRSIPPSQRADRRKNSH